MKGILILTTVIGLWGMFITIELSGISNHLNEINEALKKLKNDVKVSDLKFKRRQRDD